MERFNHEPGPRHTDLAEAQKDIDNLHAALTSQPVIEQAKGILMAHHNCGPDHAFRLLADASQRQNRKLRDIAAAVVASVQATPRDWPSHPIVIEARGRRRR
jgi:AmiR/NasT family two-component response regulator